VARVRIRETSLKEILGGIIANEIGIEKLTME
jgi:hypothetical protein